MDNSKDTKQLFRVVHNFTGYNTHNPLLPGNTSKEIAEGFAQFFASKNNQNTTIFYRNPQYHPIEETNTPKLTSFRSFTDEEVKREIMCMKNKNCELDQISTQILKEINTTCRHPSHT